ncbi:MAG: hypothetical protein V4581_03700 [Bacteroidota bacterium]
MKYSILITIFFISTTAFCQTPADINKAIGLPDSLSYVREIRVYKDRGTSNYAPVFRFYEYEEGKWKAELYNYFVGGKNAKTDITSSKDLNYIWNDILNDHILVMPNQDKIAYKLEFPSEIIVEDGKYNSIVRHVTIMDGAEYEIFIRSGAKQNHINYSNPESYLKHFPGVDELESVVVLINIIRNDFNIWKK